MDYSSLFAGFGSEEEKDPFISFLTSPTPSAATTSLLPDCSNGIGIIQTQNQKKTELQKQKKRESDRRYRENKNKAAMETKNKLDMTAIENKKLKSTVGELQQEIIQLAKQLKLIELRPGNINAELEKEINSLRMENEITKRLLNDAITSYTSNMVKVLKENEELKRRIEDKEVIIAGLTEKLNKI